MKSNTRTIGVLLFVYAVCFIFAPFIVGVVLGYGWPVGLIAFAGLSLSLLIAAILLGHVTRTRNGKPNG